MRDSTVRNDNGELTQIRREYVNPGVSVVPGALIGYTLAAFVIGTNAYATEVNFMQIIFGLPRKLPII